MGNALAVYERIQNPVAFCTDEKMMHAISSMTGCAVQQAPSVLMTCLCEGITPLEYARTYHNIQGKSAMRADAMLAKFRAQYGGKHKIIERSSGMAAIELTNKDGDVCKFSFTWEEAQASRWPWKDPDDHDKGLKDNWSTPTDRKNMLWARLVSDSIRAFQPEIVAGIYTPEELADLNVVGTEIRTDAPRPSAAELATLAAAAVEGEQAPFDDVEDAKFEPASEAAAALADAQAETETPDDPAYSSKAQREQIVSLSKQLIDAGKLPPDAVEKAMAKRGVQSLRSLKREDAAEIIDKLAAKKRELDGGSEGN